MSAKRQSAAMAEERSGGGLKVVYWPLDRLIPYGRNARTHSEAQVAEIAGSIRAFGFTNPALVGEEGDVIAGHGRLAAARQLGLSEVPVIVLSGLSELQRRQLVLADNRIALNAGWDMELLSLELKDLADLGVDLSSLGFSEDELAKALSPEATMGLTDEDEVPDVAEAPVSRPGDLWCFGPHRIACGDSTDQETVGVLLDGVRPELMVTDPPYGVGYDPAWQGQERPTGRLERGLGPLPRRRRLCLAWRPSCGHGSREPGEAGLRHPGPDHLGQGAPGYRPRRLSLAA